MNTIYRIVWNTTTGKWVVASELAHGRKKSSSRLMAPALALALAVGGGSAFAYTADGTQATTHELAVSKEACVASGGALTTQGVCTTAVVAQPSFAVTAAGVQAPSAGAKAIITSGYFAADGLGDGSDLPQVADNLSGVAAGSAASAMGNFAVAIGAESNASGSNATALGGLAQAAGPNATAVGTNARATATDTVAMGNAARAIGNSAIAVGLNAESSGISTVAIGNGANASGSQSQAMGTRAVATGNSAVALGWQASVGSGISNAVALGANSVATVSNTVSVGSVGSERRVVNVAAGMLSPTSTDAVNGSQLFATQTRANDAFAAVASSFGGGASYDQVTGLFSHPSYTIQGTAHDNVGDALGAVNGDITNIYSQLGGIGAGLVTQDAVTGAISVASATGGTTVDFTGAAGARTLKGVADGVEDTDAVNLSQLKKAGLVGDGGELMDAVVYDAGSAQTSVTFGGVAGTRLTNVMAGLVAPGSMDAINGSQLWDVQDQLDRLGDRVVNIENGTTPIPGGPGTGNPGGGDNPHFASSGDAAKPAEATGQQSVAIGEGAKSTADNSVALGAGSVADRENTVSVGAKDAERQITNVAAGTERTDAANWGQVQDALSTANQYTDDRFNAVSKKLNENARQANRGIAASAALIDNMPYLPGKTTVNAGVAAYRGESALGLGVSRWNDSGRVNFNAGVSAARNDSPIFRVGVGVVLGD